MGRKKHFRKLNCIFTQNLVLLYYVALIYISNKQGPSQKLIKTFGIAYWPNRAAYLLYSIVDIDDYSAVIVENFTFQLYFTALQHHRYRQIQR
jgi:hypothetical protein